MLYTSVTNKHHQKYSHTQNLQNIQQKYSHIQNLQNIQQTQLQKQIPNKT